MDLNAYVYGDVMVLTRILSQVAMIFDGNNFIVAAKASALMGIIIAMWSGIARGGQLSASIFFWPLLVTVLVITPRVNIVIEDQSGGMARVDDLPVGFAAPVSIITTIGAGLSTMLTENLGLDSTSVTMDNGHLVALRAPMVYAQVITDKDFQGTAAQFDSGLSPTKDTIRYVQSCLSWANKSASATAKMHQLQNEQLSDLRIDAAAMTVGASNGLIYECDALFDALMEGFESTGFQDALNTSINQFFGKYQDDTTTAQRYQTALENIVPDVTRFYALTAFANAFAEAPNDLIQAAGGGSQEAALQDALAQKREKNYGAAAIVFETISYTIGFMEAWSFSIIPMVLLLLMLGSVGAKISVKYFWMLVWIQLWYPTILIVMGYLDASMDGMSVSAMTSVSNYNAFMRELARLQDVGYMNFSMATALSMFLVFGTSSALGAAMQKDIAGGEFYDQKKNAPDTLSRAPHYSFGSDFTGSRNAGLRGVDAREAFGGATFTFDVARADGVSYSQMEAMASGSNFSTGTVASEGTGSSSVRSASDQRAAADRSTVGRDSSSSLSFGTSITQGRQVGDASSSADIYGHTNSVGGSGSGSLGFGGKTPQGAKVRGSVGAQASSTFSHSSSESQNQNTGYNMGTEIGGRVSNSATARQGEEQSDTSTKTSARSDDYRTSAQSSQESRIGQQASRTSQLSDAQSSSEMVSRHAGQVFDAILVANGVARDPSSYKMLNDLVNSSPEVRRSVDGFLNSNADKLDATFSPFDDKPAFAFAALYVTQGLYGGNLFPNDPNSKERMQALNVLSDEIMFRSGFGSKPADSEPVSVEAMREMAPVEPSEVMAGSAKNIIRYALNEEAAMSAASRTPLGPDGDANFDRYLKELGMNLENLTGGQLNGLFSTYRERLDANRARTDSDTEDFMTLYRDVGLGRALNNSLWLSDAMSLRRDAVNEGYDDAKSDVEGRAPLFGTRPSDSPEEDMRNAEKMLDHRMMSFKEAGIATDNNELARFMAATQLEAGAIARDETVDAALFSQMRKAMVDADPVLQTADTGKRIEAFAMTGAGPEALTDAYYNAQNEYGLGAMVGAAESRSGQDIRSDGQGVEWAPLSLPSPGLIGQSVEPALMYNYMTQEKGLAPHVAEGMLHNMKDESGFDPTIVGDNGNAVGLFQHNGPRMHRLKDYLEERGTDLTDWKAQIDFAVDELSSTERKAGQALAKTATASEAAIVFLEEFERPAETHRKARSEKYESI